MFNIKLWPGLILSLSSIIVYASQVETLNEEAQAFEQCQHYTKNLVKIYPNEPTIDCKLMNYNAYQWQCFEKMHLQLKIARKKALVQCFKSSPALKQFKQASPSSTRRDACSKAFSSFAKFYPGDDRLELFAKQCPTTVMSVLTWQCMNKFAEAGNSYNYAAGQCLPRKTITM